MSDSETLRSNRMSLATRLAESLDYALTADLPSEAALIAALITAILQNQATDLLIALRTTKPGA